MGNSEWYYEGIFWDGMPDLALENEAVKRELEKAADFRLEMGTDSSPAAGMAGGVLCDFMRHGRGNYGNRLAGMRSGRV